MSDAMKQERSPKATEGISSNSAEAAAIKTVSSLWGLGEKARSVAKMVVQQPALKAATLLLLVGAGCSNAETPTSFAPDGVTIPAVTRTAEATKTPEKEALSGFTVYRSKNSEESYEISYPIGWYNGVDNEHGISFHKGPANESKEGDQFTTVRVSNVDSYSESAKLSLDAYKDQKVLEYRQKHLFSDDKTKPSAEVKESKVKVNGRDIWRLDIDYREDVSNLDLKIVKYIFEESGTKWEIDFSSKPENFEKELPRFEQIASSFQAS